MISNDLRQKTILMVNYEGPALVVDGKYSACRDIPLPKASLYFSNKDLPLWKKMMSARSHGFFLYNDYHIPGKTSLFWIYRKE